MTWAVYADEQSEDRHVMPMNDLMQHTPSRTCFCNPTKDENVWVHHSVDRREENERAQEKEGLVKW